MSNKYHITYTPGLAHFFLEKKCSIILSTYQAGKVITIGSTDGIDLYQIPVSFKKPMGIALHDSKLAIASLEEVTFFSNNEDISKTINLNDRKFDSVYLQRSEYNSSTLDIHDIHFGDGILWGVNTLFSCLCTFDINYNFRPKWKPPFIDALAPEDRCHLNGMAFDEKSKLPKYVTALGTTNTMKGWRLTKMSGGVLMEVPSGETILKGLAMPHSPEIIDGELYLLESGKGTLIKVDTETREAEVIFDFGCFVRGISHCDGFLFIGKSKIRNSSSTVSDFDDLDVKENSINAGVIIFDLKRKVIIGEINYDNTVEEIYDIKVFKGLRKPLVLGNKSDKYKKIITFPGNVFWRKEKENK